MDRYLLLLNLTGFEGCISTIYCVVLLNYVGLQVCRSIPIAERNKFEICINRYIHIAQFIGLVGVSITVACNKNDINDRTGYIPRN